MPTITLKPANAEIKVVDPAAGFSRVPNEPREYPVNAYWLRRVKDGDMVRVEADEAAAATKPQAAGAKPKPTPLPDSKA